MAYYFRIFFMLLLAASSVLFSYPYTGFAHTSLERTEPAQGSTVEQEVERIELTFSSQILELSTITVTDQDGVQRSTAETKVEGNQLIAVLEEPLSTGEYTVNWNVAASDGHILPGSYTFTVAVETEEETEKTETVESMAPEEKADGTNAEEASASETNASETNASETNASEANAIEANVQLEPEKPEEGKMSGFALITAGLAVAILILSVFLFRKKRIS